MFDVLTSATSAVAVGAIYKALIELFELHRVRDSSKAVSQIRNEIAHSSLHVPEKELSNQVAFQILEEIQARKRKGLNKLTERELRRIALSLSKIAEKRASAESLGDKRAGKVILETLRKKYPLSTDPSA